MTTLLQLGVPCQCILILFSRRKSGPASIEQPLLVSSSESKCGNRSQGFQAIGLAGKSIKTC